MIDRKAIQNSIEMIKNGQIPNYADEFLFSRPILQAVGDDRKGLEKLLREMSLDDLEHMSGFFDDFYAMWNDDRMFNFLNSLSQQLKDAGYSSAW